MFEQRSIVVQGLGDAATLHLEDDAARVGDEELARLYQRLVGGIA